MSDKLEDLRIAYVEACNEVDVIESAIRAGEEALLRRDDADRKLTLARRAYLEAARTAPLPDVQTPQEPDDAPEGVVVSGEPWPGSDQNAVAAPDEGYEPAQPVGDEGHNGLTYDPGPFRAVSLGTKGSTSVSLETD